MDLGPGAGPRGGEIVAQGTLEDSFAREEFADCGLPVRSRADRIPETANRAAISCRQLRRLDHDRGATRKQSQECDASFPLGLLHLRDRCFRKRQIHPGRRHAAARALPPFLQFERQAGRASRSQRTRSTRQSHRHRPERDWPHSAFESDHLHRRVYADPRIVQPASGRAGSRLRCGAIQFQCQRRPVRKLRRRRAD